MTDKNKITLAIGLIFGVLGFVAKLIYRPWILDNNFNDLGINEFSPSFFYTIGLCLIGASISQKNPKKIMVYIALGSTAYELEQIFTNTYFDYKDLVSIVIAFLLGLVIYQIIALKSTKTKY